MEEDVTDSSRNLGSAEMLQGMPPTRRLFASRLCNAKPDPDCVSNISLHVPVANLSNFTRTSHPRIHVSDDYLTSVFRILGNQPYSTLQIGKM
jgi:hypothetical protein